MEDVLTEAIRAAAPTLKEFAVLLGALAAWRASRHAKSVHDEVKTNHGKRAGEYLEMVADVQQSTLVNTARLKVLSHQLTEHTMDDERQLAALNARMNELSEAVSGH